MALKSSEWHDFDVRAEVPAGAEHERWCEYWQVSGGDHGSVYFDEVDWYSPVLYRSVCALRRSSYGCV